MRRQQWRVPSKQKGESLAPVTLKLPRPFSQALKQYAAEESHAQQKKISQSTILFTLALQGSPRLRQLLHEHEQLSDPSSSSSPAV